MSFYDDLKQAALEAEQQPEPRTGLSSIQQSSQSFFDELEQAVKEAEGWATPAEPAADISPEFRAQLEQAASEGLASTPVTTPAPQPAPPPSWEERLQKELPVKPEGDIRLGLGSLVERQQAAPEMVQPRPARETLAPTDLLERAKIGDISTVGREIRVAEAKAAGVLKQVPVTIQRAIQRSAAQQMRANKFLGLESPERVKEYEDYIAQQEMQEPSGVAETKLGKGFLDAVSSTTMMAHGLARGAAAGSGMALAISAVPGGVVLAPEAFMWGMTTGQLDYWLKDGIATIDTEMERLQVDPAIARPLTLAGAAVYAGIEFVSDNFRLIPGFGTGTSAVLDKVKNRFVRALIAKSIQWGKELSEETFQAPAVDVPVLLAEVMSGMVESGEIDERVANVVQRSVEATQQAVIPIGFMAAGNISADAALTWAQRARQTQQDAKAQLWQSIEEGFPEMVRTAEYEAAKQRLARREELERKSDEQGFLPVQEALELGQLHDPSRPSDQLIVDQFVRAQRIKELELAQASGRVLRVDELLEMETLRKGAPLSKAEEAMNDNIADGKIKLIETGRADEVRAAAQPTPDVEEPPAAGPPPAAGEPTPVAQMRISVPLEALRAEKQGERTFHIMPDGQVMAGRAPETAPDTELTLEPGETLSETIKTAVPDAEIAVLEAPTLQKAPEGAIPPKRRPALGRPGVAQPEAQPAPAVAVVEPQAQPPSGPSQEAREQPPTIEAIRPTPQATPAGPVISEVPHGTPSPAISKLRKKGEPSEKQLAARQKFAEAARARAAAKKIKMPVPVSQRPVEPAPSTPPQDVEGVQKPVEPSAPTAGERKGPELMTPEEIRANWDRVHAEAGKPLVKRATFHESRVLQALDAQKPVSASAVDAYGIKLPEGYVREGDRYVYKPSAPAPKELPKAVTEPTAEPAPAKTEREIPAKEVTAPLDAGSRNSPSVIKKMTYADLKYTARSAKYPNTGMTVWETIGKRMPSMTDLRQGLLNHRAWYMAAEGKSERPGISPETRMKMKAAGQERMRAHREEQELDQIAASEMRQAHSGEDQVVNEAEIEPEALVRKGNEWFKAKKEDGATILEDGTRIRLQDFESTEAKNVITKENPAYKYALEEYRKQEKQRVPPVSFVKAVDPRTGQTELIGQDEGGFQLVGQKTTDGERIAQERRASEEARAISERQQQDLLATTPVQAEPTAPLSVEDALNQGQKIRAPKGATFIRVTDDQGRKSVVRIADVNTLKGAGPYKKVEFGIAGGKGKGFMPMKSKGEISVIKTRETDKGVAMYGDVGTGGRYEQRRPEEQERRGIADTGWTGDTRTDDQWKALRQQSRARWKRLADARIRAGTGREAGVAEKEHWQGVTYSGTTEASESFRKAQTVFGRAGFETVPISWVPWGASVDDETKIVYWGEMDSRQESDEYLRHELTHIQARAGNANVASMMDSVNLQHPKAKDLQETTGLSGPRLSEEIVAAYVSGGVEQVSAVFTSPQQETRERIRQDQNRWMRPVSTQYGDIAPRQMQKSRFENGDVLEERARNTFDTTEDIDASNYVLTDGTGINLGEGDHRDIVAVFRKGIPPGYYNDAGSSSGYMLAFMGETGAMRTRTSSDGELHISLIRPITTEQARAIETTRATRITVDWLGKDYSTRASASFNPEYEMEDMIEAMRSEPRMRATQYGDIAPFYSALQRAVEAMPLKQAIPGDQMLNKIKGLPGVKAQEIEETGLVDYLAMQKEQGKNVTKAEVVEFLKQNGVRLESITKGALSHQNKIRLRHLQTNEIILNERERNELRTLERQAGIEGTGQWAEGGDTKFSEYAPPGGVPGSYREVLLTVPSSNAIPEGYYLRKEGDVWRFYTREGLNASGDFDSEDEARREFAKTFAKKNEGYTSPHWSEPNVIAHMLMDERRIPVEVLERTQPELAAKLRAEGKTEARALHMIEGQSDWIQRGTAEGFETKETKLQREQALQMRREQEAFNEKLRSEAEKKRIIAGRTVHFDWYDSDNVMVLSEDGAYWSQHHVQRNWGPNAILDKAIRDSEEYKTFVALQKQYRDPRGIVIPDSGIPPAPFKGDAWKRLVIRKMLSEAAKGGYDMLTWSTGADRAAKWGSERVEWKRTGTDRDLTDAERADVIASGGKVTRTGDQWTVAGTEQSGGEHAGMNLEQAARERGILLEQKGQTVRTKDDLRRIVEGILRSPEAGKVDKLTDRIWIRMQTEPEGTSMPRREFFEFLYDKSFVQEANDIIRKMDKGAKVAETQLALMGKDSDKWGLGDKLMPPVHAIVITPSLSSGISKGQPYYGELKGAPNEDVQRAERGSRTLSEVRETITRRLSRIQSRQENELPNDTRVRRKRKLDAWLSEVDGQDEYFRNIWSNARYDEALEKTPRFLDAERAFSKLGYDTVPITDLRGRGGMVHPGKRTVFIANTQEYIFYGFIAHEATHILAGQNNVDVAALVSAIDSNSHRFIEEHAKLPHLSVSEMKEELAAAIVSGRTDLLSVIEEGASPDLARKAQDAVIENVTGSPVRESAKASDAAYLAAVERGDLETAQRMVDEAAKKAGYNIGPMWHGTRTGMFTEFTSLPAWFTDSVDYARVYTGTDRIMLDSTSSTTGRGKRDDGRPETKRVFLQAKNLKQLSLPAEAIITEEDAKKILGDNVDIALPSLPTSSGENGRAVKLSGYGYFGREVEATLLPNGKLRVDREKPWHYTDGELEDVYLHLAEDEAPPAPPTEAQRRTLARMWLGIDSPIPNATTGASTQGWAFQGMSSPDELSALYGDGAHQEIVPTGPHRLYESVRDPLTTRVLKGAGYDGIEMEDQGTRTVGVFSASQIKSADAVTRDDAGRVIPLSERFNPKTPDIRYAELTPEEQRRRDRAANIRRIAGLPPIETPAEAEPEAKLNRAGRNKALARLREDIKVQKNRRETIINAARELLPLTKDQQRVLAVLRPTYRALGQTEMGMEAFLKAIDLIEEISEEMAVREAARKLTNIIPKPRDIAEMRPALRDKMTELLEGIDLTRMAGKTRESLKKMAAWLANPETNFEGIPQEALEKMQTRLGRLDKKAITDFSVEEIEAMTNMVKSYLHQQKLIEKLEEKQETREDYRIARQIAAEIMEKKPLPSVHLGAEREKSALGRFNLRTAELWNALRTRGGATQRTLARRMGPTMLKYFHENPYRGLSTTADIIHGQWASLKTALDRAGYKWGSKELQALSDIASGEDKAKTETITLEDGRKMQLTGAEIITLLAHGDQPYVVKQIANGTVGFMPRSAKLVRGRAPYRITLDDVNNIRRSYPKLYKAARAMIDVMAELKDDLNAKSVELYDYEMFREDDYFPILTSELYRRENAKGDDRSEDTMQAWFMATPENQAMMQERTGGSGVIVLDDAFGAFHKHAHGSGAFMGMQEHITKARTLLGIPEVKEAIASTYGMPTVREWKDRIKTWTLMAQPGETSTEVEGWWSRRLGDVVRAKLAFNPSPILKQVGGLFPLLSQLGETPGEQWRILSKYGLPNMFRPEWHQRTYKYAPLLRERNEMQAGTLVSVQGPGARAKPFLGREGVLNRLMRGMSWSDANNSVAAFASFWGKLKEQHPDWTDDQLGKAAGPLAEDAVGLTQNASNIMDATGIALQAKRSLALRLVTTFKSQQMAIYNTILDAGDKFQKSKHTAQDFATFAHTVVMSLGAASLYAAGVTTLLSSAKYAFLRLLLGKPDREDEKREGWLKRLVWTMLADAAATGNYLGSELIDAAHAFARFMESGRPMNLDVNNRNLLSDAIGNVFEAINKVTKAKDAADYAEVAADVALFAANVFGAPEYPIRLAKTAAQIAGEEYKGGLKKAKAPKPLKKIKPPKKVRQ